jgi:RHS repeat-associated protein
MQFDVAGTGALTAANLSHRYLWGPAVDQLLADEQVTNGDLLVWALGDNQNTVRDLATYSNGVTTVVNHRVFSAYGQLVSQTNAAVNCLFAYTGRPLDTATGLQNNDNRWYNAIIGRWLSQDTTGFGGGDANLYRYCGNGPTDATDPSGLLDLSGFTNAQLETALASAKSGMAPLNRVLATGQSLSSAGGVQVGNPLTGAKDPVMNAYEAETSYLLLDTVSLIGGSEFWLITWPGYRLCATPHNRLTWLQIWAINEIPRLQRFIDLVAAELKRRTPPPPGSVPVPPKSYIPQQSGQPFGGGVGIM